MMKDFIIITGGDAAYFPLIEELLQSIADSAPNGLTVPLGLIDAGLTDAQKQTLAARGVQIVSPPWEHDISPLKHRNRLYLRANLGKVFLPKYFPQYQTLIWLDADAWVQDWAAVELLYQGAQTGALTICPQSGRYFKVDVPVRWWLGPLNSVRSINFKNASRAGLPWRICQALALKPTLNAGAYALQATAPHWAAMQRWQEKIIKKGRLFTSDQLAMALATHYEGLPLHYLPEWCNYMGPWRMDAETRTLVEYYLPFRKIGFVHLAGLDAMRRDETETLPVADLAGREVQLSLRYKAWRK